MFYVYEWFIIESNEVIYVGKGSRNRYKSLKHRNKMFLEFVKRFNCETRIIKTFENEQDAFEYEHQKIMEYKKIGQCVCNLDHGGYGGCHFFWTEEMREYKSLYNPMKNQAQRERMRTNNPMKNKEIAQKSNEKKMRAVIINGVKFKSVKEVQDKYGVAHETVQNWCRKGINSMNELCRYADEEQKIFKGKRYNKGGCRAVCYDGKVYESLIDVAKEVGVTNATICNWAKKGKSPNGIECKYI